MVRSGGRREIRGRTGKGRRYNTTTVLRINIHTRLSKLVYVNILYCVPSEHAVSFELP